MKEFEISLMSSEEIIKHYKIIKPIRKFNDVPYFLLNLTSIELNYTSYILLGDNSKSKKVDMNQLFAIKDVNMLHRYDNYLFFTPSIREIISQIPKELLGQVIAFEIIKQPNTYDCPHPDAFDAEFYNTYDYPHRNEFDAGFYTSTVRLYSKKV